MKEGFINKRKFISVLMAVCMVLSLIPAGLLSAYAIENNELSLGENYVHIDEGGTTYYFTPEETGVYDIYSVSEDCDPACCVYLNGESVADDDDGGDGYNFCVTLLLTADETYEIFAKEFDDDEVDYTIIIEQSDIQLLETGINTVSLNGDYCVFIPENESDFVIRSVGGAHITAEVYDNYGDQLVCAPYNDYTGDFRAVCYLEAGVMYKIYYYTDDGYDYSPYDYKADIEIIEADGFSSVSANDDLIILDDSYSYYGATGGETVYFATLKNNGHNTDHIWIECGDDEPVLPSGIGDGENGSVIYSFTMPFEDVTIYGIFSPKDYSITPMCNCEDDGLAFIACPPYADEGEEVTFEVVLDNIFAEVKDFSVTWATENEVNEIDCALDENNMCTFTMPAGDVEISADVGYADAGKYPAFDTGANTVALEGDGYAIYTYTPETDGLYEIFSNLYNGGDYEASLFGPDHKLIRRNDDYSGTHNFRIEEELTAGETYYILVQNLHSSDNEAIVTVRPRPDVCVAGHSLVLSGEIGVIFNLRFYDESIMDSFSVEFLPGNSDPVTFQLIEAEFDSDNETYLFTCYMPAYRMADMITPVVHYTKDGEEVTAELEPYSVENYVEYVCTNQDGFDYDVIRLAEALADYGYYAQAYLSDLHGFSVGKGGKYAKMDFYTTNTYNYEDVVTWASGYAVCDKEIDMESVEKLSLSLNLESATELFINITVKDDVVPAYAECSNGSDPTITHKGGNVYRVTISNILAQDLFLSHSVIVYDEYGNQLASVDVSPMHYVTAILYANAGNPQKVLLCNTVCALYNYAETADWLANGDPGLGPEPEPEPIDPNAEP